MPTSSETQAALKRPQLTRLKNLGKGMRVGRVCGERYLVRTVQPWTEMDEVEKKGLVVIPEHIKRDNTPLPSCGIIVAVGDGFGELFDPLAEGTAVMFSKFSGTDFVVSEEDFKILDAAEVLCTIEFDEPVAEVTGLRD